MRSSGPTRGPDGKRLAPTAGPYPRQGLLTAPVARAVSSGGSRDVAMGWAVPWSAHPQGHGLSPTCPTHLAAATPEGGPRQGGRRRQGPRAGDKGTPGRPAAGLVQGECGWSNSWPRQAVVGASILLKGLKILLAVNQPLLQGHGPCPSVGGRSGSVHHLCLTTARPKPPGGSRERAGEWPGVTTCPQVTR